MTICTQDDNCGPVVARGLCNKHYIRLRRSEEFEPHKKPDKCSALDCDRPVKARSVCTKHYKQLYRQENIEKLREQDRVAKQDFRQRNPAMISSIMLHTLNNAGRPQRNGWLLIQTR